jgi:hypothetical protein
VGKSGGHHGGHSGCNGELKLALNVVLLCGEGVEEKVLNRRGRSRRDITFGLFRAGILCGVVVIAVHLRVIKLIGAWDHRLLKHGVVFLLERNDEGVNGSRIKIFAAAAGFC